MKGIARQIEVPCSVSWNCEGHRSGSSALISHDNMRYSVFGWYKPPLKDNEIWASVYCLLPKTILSRCLWLWSTNVRCSTLVFSMLHPVDQGMENKFKYSEMILTFLSIKFKVFDSKLINIDGVFSLSFTLSNNLRHTGIFRRVWYEMILLVLCYISCNKQNLAKDLITET